jgi:DNA-binding Xre family transcriptional regulator
MIIPKGISMSELSAKSGISRCTLYRIKDDKQVKIRTKEKMLKTLNEMLSQLREKEKELIEIECQIQKNS